MYIDGISVCMLYLVVFIGVISYNFILNKVIYGVIFISMYLTYISYDIIYFIVCYEIILVRITALIISTGSSMKKDGLLRLLYYSLFGSMALILLICVIMSKNVNMSNNYWYLSDNICYILISIRLLMKFRIYRFLTWLLWALSESNLIGSIILSSLILKVSIWGWFRYNFDYRLVWYDKIMVILAVISILVSSLYSIMSVDAKRIIAYCSVILMSTILVSTLLKEEIGSWLISIALSLVSSGLFYLVSLIYLLYLTRNVLYMRFIGFNRVFYVFMLYFVLSNISFRLTSGFMREFIIFMLLLKNMGVFTILIIMTVLFGSILSLWLNTKILFNSRSLYLIRYIDINRFLTYNLMVFTGVNLMISWNVNIISNYII